MIERVEVLKDGASAIYGSDAVAGVVNFVTRDVEGFEINGSWTGTTQDDFFSEDQQQDMRLSIVTGWQGDKTRFSMMAGWFNRSPLDFEQRDFTLRWEETGFRLGTSGLGNPPNFIPLAATCGDDQVLYALAKVAL